MSETAGIETANNESSTVATFEMPLFYIGNSQSKKPGFVGIYMQ